MTRAELLTALDAADKYLIAAWDNQQGAQKGLDVAGQVLADATRNRDNAVASVRLAFARKVSLLESLLTKTGEI